MVALARWRVQPGAFLRWLGASLGIEGAPREIDGVLWQLGRFRDRDFHAECFFHRNGTPTEAARRRLLAYRSVIVLTPVPSTRPLDGFQGPSVCLLELLSFRGDVLETRNLLSLLRWDGAVEFDAESGALYAGDLYLGDAAMGSREYHMLDRLAQEIDRFVPYADLKRWVLERTGGTDETDEGTFCQRLKSRLKKRIPRLDDVIATTNKGDGYRLCGRVERTVGGVGER
jgi:hypothetical protein